MLQYLVIVGALAQFLGILSYVKETIRGNTKPNRISWLFWTIAPFIGTAAALTSGVRWATLPVFMAGFGPLLVFIASFVNKKAYWKLEVFDYFCGLCSLLACVLWIITKQPLVAIVFAILSDAFAGVPTVIKSWRYPETETVHPYVTGFLSALTSFAAISKWSFSSYAFPAYLLLINSSLVFAYYRKKIWQNKTI